MRHKVVFYFLFLIVTSCTNYKKNAKPNKNDENIAVKRNDLVELKYTDLLDKKTYTLKRRIIGIPGDTILIVKGVVFINSKAQDLPKSTKYHYTIGLKYFSEEMQQFLDRNNKNLQGLYNAYFSAEDSSAFVSKYHDAITLMQRGYDQEVNQQVLLNYRNKLGWTLDDFGPVNVPKIGDKVHLEYAKAFLNTYDKNNLSDSVTINQPYYFVIGENFHDNTDSRFIGLIGKSQILKVINPSF